MRDQPRPHPPSTLVGEIPGTDGLVHEVHASTDPSFRPQRPCPGCDLCRRTPRWMLAWREDRMWCSSWLGDRVSAGIEWDPDQLGLSLGVSHTPRRNPAMPTDLRFHLWLGPVTLVAHVEVGRRTSRVDT